MIVIPDIHGRAFWKDAVNGKEIEKIIFLGDYIDPYPDEDISPEEAFENFKEIVEFKKQNNDNVVLLIGNHDCHYFYPGFERCTRYCRRMSRELEKFYQDNFGIFKIAHEEVIDGKRFVFSHSYIHKLWLDDVYGEDGWYENTVIDELNNDFSRQIYGLGCALSRMSVYRGGLFESYGSMVWADIREINIFKKPVIGDYSVFGHTSLYRPVVTEYKACVDCCRGFLINENGKICELDRTEVPIDKPNKK